jgi:hypothetical protein
MRLHSWGLQLQQAKQQQRHNGQQIKPTLLKYAVALSYVCGCTPGDFSCGQRQKQQQQQQQQKTHGGLQSWQQQCTAPHQL